MSSVRISIAIVLLASGIQAAAPPPPAAHPRPSTPQAGARAALSDAQIEAEIRARFARSKIHTDKFQVHVQGGIATIEGRTDVMQHKGVATRMAKNSGAVAVNNHVQISEAAKEKAAANLEKGRRRAQIKRGEPRSEAR